MYQCVFSGVILHPAVSCIDTSLFLAGQDTCPKYHLFSTCTAENSIRKTTVHKCVWFTFEMKGMCILVYGLMSLIRTWVLMFLSSSVTEHTRSHSSSVSTPCERASERASPCTGPRSRSHSPSMCSRINGSSMMLLWFVFRIFSNSVISLFW